MTLPFLICATVTAISAIVSLGFSIIAFRSRSGEARTLALYASARSLALVVVSVAAFPVGATAWLASVACCMIVVQACDAAIGVTIKDRLKTFGVLAVFDDWVAAFLYRMGEPTLSLVAGPDLGPSRNLEL